MENFVYILYSASLDRFYVGQTQDLETRLQRHNSGRNKSSISLMSSMLVISLFSCIRKRIYTVPGSRTW
ncbi:GIY-YIG nuclease family protein [Cyclobacterium sp.]|uniref:GIY-YIG nuclease family protein n=1 Tax=Cyclobacterium sp. TaxID=1966343 RepID=UPI003970B0D5